MRSSEWAETLYPESFGLLDVFFFFLFFLYQLNFTTRFCSVAITAASITQTFNVEHASNNDTRSLEDEQRFVLLFEFSAASRTKLHKHSVYSSA